MVNLNIYDNRGNYIFRTKSFGNGSVTKVKNKIDSLLKIDE